MPYFCYRDKDIYYEENGSGTPLLLLHGNTASGAMFASLVPELAKRFRVIVIDFLGCGRSARVPALAEDLWYDEALQAAALLDFLGCERAFVIGSSGGAIAAINLALERPELVEKLVADSFEGERALSDVTESIAAQREASKQDEGARRFYEAMNGEDWESAVDADTDAILAHATHIGNFYHQPLSSLKADILLCGSLGDEFAPPGFFEQVYGDILKKTEHGEMHLFESGSHPAMLSNMKEFVRLCEEFFAR